MALRHFQTTKIAIHATWKDQPSSILYEGLTDAVVVHENAYRTYNEAIGCRTSQSVKSSVKCTFI